MTTTLTKLAVVLASCALTIGGPLPAPSRASRALTDDTDNQVTARILTVYQTLFVDHPLRIHVETRQGLVQLIGLANDRQTAELAVEIACQVPGVAGVNATIFIIAAKEPAETGQEPDRNPTLRPDELRL